MNHIHKLPSNEARANWRTLLDETVLNNTITIITRYGKPVAVMMPYEYYKALKTSDLLSETI